MLKLSPRRKRERQQHIRHILDVAESIFAEQGFFRTTMRQIALKAEFALGTIYSYFGSKKQLFGKVIETKVDELVAFVTKEMADVPSVRGQTEKFIQAKMTFLHKNLPFFRLYLAEVDVPRLNAEHILPQKLRDKYDSMLRTLTDTIRQGTRQGIFKPMDAEILARTLDSLTNVFAFSYLGSKTHLSTEADMRIVTELFLHGAATRQEPTQNSNDRKELCNES